MDDKTFQLINKIAHEHCFKTFGYFDEEDLKGEIWLICLEKLKEYNEDRGELEHFLRVAVKNRLINRFKDVTKSVRSPCPRCPFYRAKKVPDCAMFGHEKIECDKWHNYKLSTESRNSLLNASESQVERNINERSYQKLVTEEIKQKVLKNIKQEFINDFNTLIDGGRLSKKRLKKLQIEILSIIGKNDE